MHSCEECYAPVEVLTDVKNARGQIIGSFCPKCADLARQIVRAVNMLHGAHYVGRNIFTSPHGTPSFHSIGEGRYYVKQANRARAQSDREPVVG